MGKGKKCWLPAFFPFPIMFSKGLFLRIVKSRDCVVKGLTTTRFETQVPTFAVSFFF